IAEAAGLGAIAIDRDVLAVQRLRDEVRNHPAVIGVHAWPVGVEDPHHLDSQPVLAPVIEEQSLGTALALIVARTHTDRVHTTPIALGLRMDFGVAIDL